jgi:hypothetical protein
MLDQGTEVLAFEKALANARSWAETYQTSDNIPDDKLPAKFDWRNQDGHDFTNSIRN